MPNAKYLRVVLHSTGLTNCKPAPTPCVVGSVKHKPDDDVDLDMQECRLYREIVGCLQYLSMERCDVQFETNACAKEMKQPTKASWTRLKRLARYLAGTQSARVVLMKPGTYCPREAFLRVWSDSSAGDAKDRKCQSSLNIEVDGCPLYSASRKQKARAHSSGEAEHCAAASAASEAMLIRESLLFTGLEVRTELLLDSAAAFADAKVSEPYDICQRKFFGYSSW